MAIGLIKLEDGNLVEVEIPGDEARNISGNFKKVKGTIAAIQPLIVEACRPIASAWQQVHQELSKDMIIEEAEVELGLNFSFGGDVYIAKSTVGANLKVKLKLKPQDK